MTASLSNKKIAQWLFEFADALGRRHEDGFRINAYRHAAEAVLQQTQSVAAMVRAGKPLIAIPGIGASIARTITQIVLTGKPPLLDDNTRPRRGHMRRTMSMPPGQAIRTMMRPVVEKIVADLSQLHGVSLVMPTGAYRRRADVIDGIGLLVACESSSEVLRAWKQKLPAQAGASIRGEAIDLTTPDGIRLHVRFVSPRDAAWAALEETGSQEHLRALKKWARQKGKLWPPTTRPAPRNVEAGIYRALGLTWVPPELRETGDEVPLAGAGKLPRLVRKASLRGDLHVHTDATDGACTIQEMAEAAKARGLEYIAITDHTQRTSIAHGLTSDEMRTHLRRIDKANDAIDGFTILKGAEVDILKGGRLDLPDDLLDELDVVVCSLHHRDRRDGRELTQRILTAMEHPRAHILGHPSGRLIGKRAPMDLDWNALIDSAAQRGWAFEIDGQYDRMDLPAPIARAAAARGVRFSIASDAHSIQELDFLWSALDQARRGWVDKRLVLNALPLDKMLKALRKPAKIQAAA